MFQFVVMVGLDLTVTNSVSVETHLKCVTSRQDTVEVDVLLVNRDQRVSKVRHIQVLLQNNLLFLSAVPNKLSILKVT